MQLPADARRSLAIYNLVFPVVFVAFLPAYFMRMMRRGGYREKFWQRFGRFTASDRRRFAGGNWIWLHSISVGETLLAVKLARRIRECDPSRSIVLSVTTSTGFTVAQSAACDWLEVIYNPLDLPAIVRHTLDAIRPKQIIFIEAIWPNLLADAKRREIPTGYIPRLSPRSERRFRRFARYVSPIFRLLDRLAVPEPSDIPRWQSLGVPADRIAVTGNSKFDHPRSSTNRSEQFRKLLIGCGIAGHTPILLGGSTFPGEERILAKLLLDLRIEFPDLVLILVPRHVERTDDILRDLLPFDFKITLRTALVPRDDEAALDNRERRSDILLVNTTGELRDWYHLATVVFIGKSLMSTGGQNPVEPVIAGSPVVFGPHMENFEPIVTQWLAADAAVQIQDAASLGAAIGQLLRDPDRRHSIAARALEIASRHEGATTRTIDFLLSSGQHPRNQQVSD